MSGGLNSLAFPTHPQINPDNAGGNGGMSLRDWFAGQALSHALSATASHDGCYDHVAAAWGAYDVADAMLAVRAEAAAPVAPAPIPIPIPEICADCKMPEPDCDCVPF